MTLVAGRKCNGLHPPGGEATSKFVETTNAFTVYTDARQFWLVAVCWADVTIIIIVEHCWLCAADLQRVQRVQSHLRSRSKFSHKNLVDVCRKVIPLWKISSSRHRTMRKQHRRWSRTCLRFHACYIIYIVSFVHCWSAGLYRFNGQHRVLKEPILVHVRV